MTFVVESRVSDSPLIATITHGYTASAGVTIRPAEIHWHMIVANYESTVKFLLVGPLSTSGIVRYGAGAELLWIKLGLGTYMPHLPTRHFLDQETALPEASSRNFWLKSEAWQLPNHENVETFIAQLVRADVLAYDPLVKAALQGQLAPDVAAPRTIRHRFLQATGLTQNHIQQFERAQRAAALLQQGVSILDTVYETGYFDQPHLTRSLKQFIGFTPSQISRSSKEGG